MTEAFHLVFRRMRLPLNILIISYAVSILGFVLIPGETPAGEREPMSFFHAFYFVSFMGSTIGFGEIPYPFTAGQRLWAMFSIYATVIAWLYAIGALLAAIQDPAFRRQLARNGFTRAVRRIKEPFYLVCGYGDTGSLLVRGLSYNAIRTVVIDLDPAKIEALKVTDFIEHVPALCDDATQPEALADGGVKNPLCAGVIALTNDDQANLSIAITCKIFVPDLQVIARTEYQETATNMKSFGTDHTIDPFDRFADRFSLAIRSPALFMTYMLLTSPRHIRMNRALQPPRGLWLVCGYGRCGKALYRHLQFDDMQTQVIEVDPGHTKPPPDTITETGTEADTLRKAGIEQAVGIIAATNHDANNLSIVLTARELNPELFTVARLTRGANYPLFDAAWLDIMMQPATIITREALALINTPLLIDFINLIREQSDEWANILFSRIIAVSEDDDPPETWTLTICSQQTPAITDLLRRGTPVDLSIFACDPRHHKDRLAALILLQRRATSDILAPDNTEPLAPGDRLLFCGTAYAKQLSMWTAVNHGTLNYVLTGNERPDGWLWRWLSRHQHRLTPGTNGSASL